MKRSIIFAAAVALGWLGVTSTGSAQVFIRAPFVRVGVGDGVYVRAPFFRLYVPDGPSYGPVYGPRVIPSPAPVVVPPEPARPDPNAPPPPVQAVQAPTLESFAKTFQAKSGSYEVSIVNPTTNLPATVRFTLPEGTPRRVIVNRHSIEWVYAPRTWVRIEFDRDGATVTSR